MFLSSLIALTALNDFPILGPLGRPAQAWFLRQVQSHDPALASRLHEDNGHKPYTVSTLIDDRGYPLKAGHWLKTGERCWLRITAYGDEISKVLTDQILGKLPDRLNLYKMQFRIDGCTYDPGQHPWAGKSSFSEQAQDQSLVNAKGCVRLEFLTPTAFRSNGLDIPLPVPGSVFRSYWEKWNAVASEAYQIQDIWPAFAESCIFINELTAVNTQKWEFAEKTRGAATGFMGTVGMFLASGNHKERWGELSIGSQAVMQSLARFAFYCGTGHHTTIGMGQTRLLPPKNFN